MLILRPHHLKSIIVFHKKKLYDLSEDAYVIRFREKNGRYHNRDFIVYWRNFLTKLIKNPNTEFKYILSYKDDACKKCDIIDECKDTTTHLSKLVNKLDIDFETKHKNFKLGEIYKISDLVDIQL